MAVEYGTTRQATFQPRRTETLRPEASTFVGQTLEWEYAGTMDEGPYDGQTIWTPTDKSLPWFGWVPDEDLVDA